MIEIQQIGEPKVIEDTSSESKPHTLHAHMSTMRATFANDYEVTYGNSVWDLTVFSDRRIKDDITPLWQGLSDTPHCFKLPINYVPFGYDGCTFCYSIYDKGTHIYDFSKDTRKSSKVWGIWSILCAPKEPMILISGANLENRQDGVYLIDFDGNIVLRVESLDDAPDSFVSWLMYSSSILAISKKSRQHKTWIYEIDSGTGKILQKEKFDPQDILPYDDLSYSDIIGKAALLKTKEGEAIDGLLWNEWRSFSYDFGYKRLKARICHPSIEYLNQKNRPKSSEIIGIVYEYEFKIDFS